MNILSGKSTGHKPVMTVENMNPKSIGKNHNLSVLTVHSK
jgi:hypothetical protein